MKRSGGAGALRSWLIALTCSVAGLALAASAADVQPDKSPSASAAQPKTQTPEEQLDEVFVEGRRYQKKPKLPSFKDYQQPFDWMARLVGRFAIDGAVDLHAQGRPEDLRKVSGRAECIGFGIAPGVQCNLQVRWPETEGPNGEEILGGVSTLNHAVALFGFEPVNPNLPLRVSGPGVPDEPPEPGVSFIVVDNAGVAETAVGQMVTADTMQSRAKCVAIPGNCERLTRITAQPDHINVEMKIDITIDQEKVVGYTFVMHRLSGTDSRVYGRKQDQKKK